MSAMEILKFYENKIKSGRRLTDREQREYDAYAYSLRPKP